MCVSKLCVDKLCVSKLCGDKLCVVKLCVKTGGRAGGQAGERRKAEVHIQKQEPHTKMWEKMQNKLVQGRQLCTQLSILEGSLRELLRF